MALFQGPFEPVIDDLGESKHRCYHRFLDVAHSLMRDGDKYYSATKTIAGPAFNVADQTAFYSFTCTGLSSSVNLILKEIVYTSAYGGQIKMYDWMDVNNPPPSSLRPAPQLIAQASLVSQVDTNENFPDIPDKQFTSKQNDGETRIYHTEPQWSSPYWRFNYSKAKANVEMVSYSVPADQICPPGTILNLLTGTCDVTDGWSWDPITGAYIPGRCLSVSGLQEIDSTGIYEYTIELKETQTDGSWAVIPIPSTFYSYLSNVGSNSIRNVDFIMPQKVLLVEGEMFAKFNIEFFDSIAGKTFNIDASSDYLSCGSLPVNINFESYLNGSGSGNGSCCSYYTQGYLAWQSCTRIPNPKYPGLMREDGTLAGEGEY